MRSFHIIKALLKLQASVTGEAIYWLPSMKDNVWIDTVSFITIASPVCYVSDETKCKSSQSNEDKNRIRIMNTLFNVKLQDLHKELADLLKKRLSYALFSQNFQSKCSFKLFWIAGFERLRSKTSLSKTRKACKDQKKKLNMLYRMGLLNKNWKRFDETANVGILL